MSSLIHALWYIPHDVSAAIPHLPRMPGAPRSYHKHSNGRGYPITGQSSFWLHCSFVALLLFCMLLLPLLGSATEQFYILSRKAAY